MSLENANVSCTAVNREANLSASVSTVIGGMMTPLTPEMSTS